MSKEFLRTLPVKLDSMEVAAKAKHLAAELHDLALAKEKADATKRALADDLKSREARVMTLGRTVHDRSEPREVDCHEIHDVATSTVRVYRDDTGEFVDSRPMTELEIRDARQAELPNISPGRRRVDLRAEGYTVTIPKKYGSAAEEVAAAVAELKDPDGTGTTTVTHGFTGEPQVHIGGPKPRKRGKP